MHFWNTIKHFTPLEFTNPNAMSRDLIRLLSLIREDAGVPIHVTSDFRAGSSGAHGEGLAVDISDNMEGNPVASRWRFKVLRSVFEHNINRIGIYPKHLHIDVSRSRDQDVCWWAQNK